MGTRSSPRRISGVDSSGTTPGGGLGDTPYFNLLRIVVGTQSVSANHLLLIHDYDSAGHKCGMHPLVCTPWESSVTKPS